MRMVKQTLSYALLIVLLSVACYGFSEEFITEKSQKIEVHGVINEKHQNINIKNILSYYETETQYWVRLEDGRQVQLPAYLYKKVTKGEEVFLVKMRGNTVFLSENGP